MSSPSTAEWRGTQCENCALFFASVQINPPAVNCAERTQRLVARSMACRRGCGQGRGHLAEALSARWSKPCCGRAGWELSFTCSVRDLICPPKVPMHDFHLTEKQNIPYILHI